MFAYKYTLKDNNGEPCSQTYIKTIHNQLSASMNYAVMHYGLVENPCRSASSIGKSHAEEMNIWTQEQFETAIALEHKTVYKGEFKRITALAGLEPIRVHDLRHRHAGMLINMGEELLEISRRLGHESVKTTSDTYGHLYSDKNLRLAHSTQIFRNFTGFIT